MKNNRKRLIDMPLSLIIFMTVMENKKNIFRAEELIAL